MSTKSQPEVVVRTATPNDSSACGQICYEAFSNISAAHGFPCDFPGPEAATGLLSMMFSNSGFSCVVAEADGRSVGSNRPLWDMGRAAQYGTAQRDGASPVFAGGWRQGRIATEKIDLRQLGRIMISNRDQE